jgi:site-specific recombinase XerD
MNIKSVIRKDVITKDKEHLIYIRYTYKRRYILFSTGERVKKRNWNDDSGRVKKSTNYEKINTLLEKTENKIHSLVLDLKLKDLEPTLTNLKNEIKKQDSLTDKRILGARKVDETRLLKDFQNFIDDREAKKIVEPNTLKSYKSTLKKLKEFKSKKNYSLHYNNINEEFYFSYVNFLRDDEGLLDNSIDKHLKIIKLFMNYAFEKKLHSNMFFQTYKRLRTKTDFVVLNRKELISLAYDYKPTAGSLKDKVRDMFILGCSTGLRYSDLSELTSGNFYLGKDSLTNKYIDNASETYIKIISQKTKRELKLPVNNFVFDLIKKYDIKNKEIKFLDISNQVFNKTIKGVCREAGIIDMVKISKRKGSKFVDYEFPKCELVSSHTMRRTLITLMSNSTEITNVQAISGHSDIKVLTDYIKRNDKELNSVKANLNDIFYQKDEEMVGDKASGINTRIILRE